MSEEYEAGRGPSSPGEDDATTDGKGISVPEEEPTADDPTQDDGTVTTTGRGPS